eukprot:COSAG02_NODE_2881_length_7824_cov_3.474822_3_plen_43_part_00
MCVPHLHGAAAVIMIVGFRIATVPRRLTSKVCYNVDGKDKIY